MILVALSLSSFARCSRPGRGSHTLEVALTSTADGSPSLSFPRAGRRVTGDLHHAGNTSAVELSDEVAAAPHGKENDKHVDRESDMGGADHTSEKRNTETVRSEIGEGQKAAEDSAAEHGKKQPSPKGGDDQSEGLKHGGSSKRGGERKSIGGPEWGGALDDPPTTIVVDLPNVTGMTFVSRTSGAGCCLEGKTNSDANKLVSNVTDFECESACEVDPSCVGINLGDIMPDGSTTCELLLVTTKDPTLKLCHNKRHRRCMVKPQLVQVSDGRAHTLDSLAKYVPFPWMYDLLMWQKGYDSRQFTGKAFASQDDVVRSMYLFAGNVALFCVGLVLFLFLKRRYGFLLAPAETPELLELWRSNDDDSFSEIIRVAGVDGLMFFRFFRFGIQLLLVLLATNIAFLAPAQACHASIYQFFQHPGRESCAAGSGLETEAECKIATHLYAETAVWSFSKGQCRIVEGPGAPVLICSKTVGLRTALQAFAIQNIGEFSLDRAGIYLYGAAIITTVLTVQWLVKHFMMDFLHWRRMYMLSGGSRNTIFVEKMPEGQKDVKKFFENLVQGGVRAIFQVKRPPPDFIPHVASLCRGNCGRKNCPANKSGIFIHKEWQPLRCAFVTFRKVRDAHSVSCMYLKSWDVDMAAEPGAVLWGALLLRSQPWKLYCRRVVAVGMMAALYALWSVPTTAISALSTSQAVQSLNDLKETSDNAGVRMACDALLASTTGIFNALWMSIFMSFLPMMFEGLAYLYGCPTMAHVNSWIQRHYMWFFIIYVIFVNSLTQSIVEMVWQVLDRPFDLLKILGRALPDLSWWYINYTTYAIMSLVIELLRPGRVIGHMLYRCVKGKPLWDQYYLDLPEAYGTLASRWLVYLAIAIIWSTMNPSILVVCLVVFVLARSVYKYEVLCCFRDIYDTGGLWVPVALKDIVLVLMLYQITMAGVIHERSSHKGGTFYMVFVLINLPLFASSLRFYHYLENHWDVTHMYQNISFEEPEGAQKFADYRASFKKSFKQWHETEAPSDTMRATMTATKTGHGDVGDTAITADIADENWDWEGFTDSDDEDALSVASSVGFDGGSSKAGPADQPAEPIA